MDEKKPEAKPKAKAKAPEFTTKLDWLAIGTELECDIADDPRFKGMTYTQRIQLIHHRVNNIVTTKMVKEFARNK